MSNWRQLIDRTGAKLAFPLAVLVFLVLGMTDGAYAQGQTETHLAWRQTSAIKTTTPTISPLPGDTGIVMADTTGDWTTGNASPGQYVDEGDYQSYVVVLQNYAPGDDTSAKRIVYDFHDQTGTIFIDLARNFQYKIVPNSILGSSLAGLKNVVKPNIQPGFTPFFPDNRNIPLSSIGTQAAAPDNQTAPPAFAGFDLFRATVGDTGTAPYKLRYPATTDSSLVIYYELHESNTFVWSQGKEFFLGSNTFPSQRAQGGSRYNPDGTNGTSDDWTTKYNGSGFETGASGHTHLAQTGGVKTVPIPIPEVPSGIIGGFKFSDLNFDSSYQAGTEPRLNGWLIKISTVLDGIPFEYLDTTGTGTPVGTFLFTGLAPGTYTIAESLQTGWTETFPRISTPGYTSIGAANYGSRGYQIPLISGTVDTTRAFGNFFCVAPVLTTTGDTITCAHPTATTTVNSNPSTGVTYLWTGTGLVGSATNASAQWNQSGVKTVYVTRTAGGCLDSATAYVGENKTPPTFTLSSDSITCLVATATTTASSVVPSTGITYSWSGAGLVGPSTNSSAQWSQPGYKTLTVTRSDNGCFTVDSINVKQNTTPPSFTLSADSITCLVPNATTTVTNAVPSTGITYTWSGAGLVGPSTNSSAQWSQPGYKTVRVTRTDNGCFTVDSINVKQNTTPPSFTLSADSITCLVPNATTTVINAVPSTGISYTWSGAGLVGPSTNSSAQWSQPGYKTVRVTRTDNGCFTVDSINVKKNTTPPSFTLSADSITCLVPNATTTVSNAVPATGITYSWAGAGLVGPSTNSSAQWNQQGYKSVRVTRSDDGCYTDDSIYVRQSTDKPALTLTADSITCSVPNATTTVTSNPATGVTYLWTGTGLIGPNNTTSAQWNQPGYKTVRVTRSDNGCFTDDSILVRQNTTLPLLSCSNDTLTCDSTLASATVTVSNLGSLAGGVTYLWTPSPVTGQGTNTARYSSGGPVKVVVTVNNTGCTDSCSTTIATNYAKPVCSVSPADTSVCSGGSATFCAVAGLYGYAWSGPNSFTSTSQCITVSDTGTYKVVVKNLATGCTDSCYATLHSTSCGGHIFPTQVSCDSFQLGSTELPQLCYQFSSGTVTNATPGMMFYYSYITAPANGALTVNIDQTKSLGSFNFLSINQGNQIYLYSNSCTKLAQGSQPSPGQGAVSISNAVAGQVYIVGVKYNIKTMLGSTGAGSTVKYYFSSRINTVLDPNTKDSISANPNCSATALVALKNNLMFNQSRDIPTDFALSQNYPNPFNPSTVIEYALPVGVNVTLKVYDILGREVTTLVSGVQDAGYHSVEFNASALPSGIYYYRLKAEGFTDIKKMLLVK